MCMRRRRGDTKTVILDKYGMGVGMKYRDAL